MRGGEDMDMIELEAPRDSDGSVIKIGDRLQMSGREDKPLIVDGMVVVPTYYSESAGRSCAIVRPELWHVVDDHVVDDVTEQEDSWRRIEDDFGKMTCDYFGHSGANECFGCKAYSSKEPCEQVKSHDIVRRCRALAEKETGR